MKKKYFLHYGMGVVFLSQLCGCQWADNIGNHFPVIGERCENWQCFTQSGKQASEEKKRQEQQGISPQAQPIMSPNPPSSAYPPQQNPADVNSGMVPSNP